MTMMHVSGLAQCLLLLVVALSSPRCVDSQRDTSCDDGLVLLERCGQNAVAPQDEFSFQCPDGAILARQQGCLFCVDRTHCQAVRMQANQPSDLAVVVDELDPLGHPSLDSMDMVHTAMVSTELMRDVVTAQGLHRIEDVQENEASTLLNGGEKDGRDPDATISRWYMSVPAVLAVTLIGVVIRARSRGGSAAHAHSGTAEDLEEINPFCSDQEDADQQEMTDDLEYGVQHGSDDGY